MDHSKKLKGDCGKFFGACLWPTEEERFCSQSRFFVDSACLFICKDDSVSGMSQFKSVWA